MPKLDVDKIIAMAKARTKDNNDVTEISIPAINLAMGKYSLPLPNRKLKNQVKPSDSLGAKLGQLSTFLKRKIGEDFEVSISKAGITKFSFANEELLAKFVELLI